MKKIKSLFAVTLILLTLFLFVPAQRASARALCGDTWLKNTAAYAYGSTSAYVSFSLWQHCDGSFFGSLYSHADENGFAFTGTMVFFESNGQKLYVDVTGPGYFDTGSLIVGDIFGDSFSLEFNGNHGQFYSSSNCTIDGGVAYGNSYFFW